ncbi:MAG: ABC transporter permease [Caldisericia bacterium]
MATKKKKITVIDNPNQKEILDASSYSLGKAIWERFSRHKLAVSGLVIFIALFVFTMIAPIIESTTGYQFNYTSLHMKAKPGSFPGIVVSITDPDWNDPEKYPEGFWFTDVDHVTGMATINMETFKDPRYHSFYSYTVKSYGYVEELDIVKEKAFDSRGRPIEVESDGPKVYKEFFVGKSHTKLVTQTGQIIEHNPPFDELDKQIITSGKNEGKPREVDRGEAKRHLLGTDNSGHDILPRLAYGGRVSLTIGFSVTLICGFLGIFFGSIGGYFGGFADAILMRTIELMGTIPTLPLYMVLTASLPGGNSVFVIILIFSVFGWSGNARMTRGQFLSERSMEYTEAAKAIGAGNMRIIFKHVLPNSISPVITQLSMRVGNTVLSESSLSFLGLGVNPITTPTWGALISEANSYFLEYPWPGLFAGFLIFLVVVSFFFLGDGLRDALDPRQKI